MQSDARNQSMSALDSRLANQSGSAVMLMPAGVGGCVPGQAGSAPSSVAHPTLQALQAQQVPASFSAQQTLPGYLYSAGPVCMAQSGPTAASMLASAQKFVAATSGNAPQPAWLNFPLGAGAAGSIPNASGYEFLLGLLGSPYDTSQQSLAMIPPQQLLASQQSAHLAASASLPPAPTENQPDACSFGSY